MTLPTVLVTIIIRAAQLGEQHGGLYLIDLESGDYTMPISWNACDIDWSGRGGARGLRGVAMQDDIYLAASNEIFVYDSSFNHLVSYTCPYLRHCHEIHLNYPELYITSTHYDSILVLDLERGLFTSAFCIRDGETGLYDPYSDDGPEPRDTTHLNSVFHVGSRTYFACNFLDTLRYIEDGKIRTHCHIPHNTHNARPFRGGVIYNHTGGDRVVWATTEGEVIREWLVPPYAPSEITDHPHARQQWARGLCIHNNIVITSYSPATVMVYDLDKQEVIRTITLSLNVRDAPHGLCVYEGA